MFGVFLLSKRKATSLRPASPPGKLLVLDKDTEAQKDFDEYVENRTEDAAIVETRRADAMKGVMKKSP